MDPTTALIGAIGVIAAAGVTAWSTVRTNRSVRGHINDESGTIARFEAKLDQIDGKVTEVLHWQGGHEALHARLDGG